MANTEFAPGLIRSIAAVLVVLLLLMAVGCATYVSGDVTNTLEPVKDEANEAAELAELCTAENGGTPEQVAAAQAAAQAARDAANRVGRAIRDVVETNETLLDETRPAHLAEPGRPIPEGTENMTLGQRDLHYVNTEIIAINTAAVMAMTLAGNPDPDNPAVTIRINQFQTTPEFLYGGSWLGRNDHARNSANVVRSQRDWISDTVANIIASGRASPAQLQTLQEISDEMEDLVNLAEGYENDSDPEGVAAAALSNRYRAESLGFTVLALRKQLIDLPHAQTLADEAAQRSSDAAQAYEDAKNEATAARTAAEAAAEAARAAAQSCGFTAAPPFNKDNLPDWNNTFWDISSP